MSRSSESGLFAASVGSRSDARVNSAVSTADVPGADLRTIPMPAPKFLGLEAMRGAAALVVGIAHSKMVLLASPGLGNAGFAVDFFFMLSGFVLAHAYSAKLGSGYLNEYLWRRAIRLYPLIAIGTALGFVPWYIHDGNGAYLLRLLGQGMILLPEPWSSRIDEGIFPLNPPAWSLFFEMIVSVLFGVGVWRSKRPGPLLVCVLAGAVGMVFAIAKGRSSSGWAFADMGWGLARAFYGFGAGVALYRFRESLPVPAFPLPLLVASLFLLLLVPTSSKILIGLTLFGVFPLLLLSGSRANTPVRGNIVDLIASDADIHQLPVT